MKAYIDFDPPSYETQRTGYIIKLEKQNQELKEAFVEFLQQADFDENRRIYFIPALYLERIEQLLNK